MQDLMTTLTDPASIGYGLAAVLCGTAGYIFRRPRRPSTTQQPDREPGQLLDDVLTFTAAGLATAVSAQGMWRVFEHTLDMPPWLRLGTFAFIEVAMLSSARRARANVRKTGYAGVDGIAVWLLTGLSATLSAMDADTARGVMVRLFAPLVAAWMWERGLSVHRKLVRNKDKKTRKLNWRVTPERVLVRLGLAEPTDRTASEVDAHRRLTRVTRAAKRVRALKAAGVKEDAKDMRRARARLDKVMDAAVEHAGLATNPARMQALMAQIAATYNAAALADLQPAAPWEIAPAEKPTAPRGHELTDDDLVAFGYESARVKERLKERGVDVSPAEIARALAHSPALPAVTTHLVTARPVTGTVGDRPLDGDRRPVNDRPSGHRLPVSDHPPVMSRPAVSDHTPAPTPVNDHAASDHQMTSDRQPHVTTPVTDHAPATAQPKRSVTARKASGRRRAGGRSTDDDLNKRAVQTYIAMKTDSSQKTPTKREFAAMFKMSGGWAQTRITEANALIAQGASQPVTATADTEEPVADHPAPSSGPVTDHGDADSEPADDRLATATN